MWQYAPPPALRRISINGAGNSFRSSSFGTRGFRGGGIQIPFLPGSQPVSAQHVRGKRLYELKNHLGNVTTVVSDRKIPYFDGSSGDLVYFSPEVASAQDYYPFGSIMPGRSFSSDSYRYGFQGQEQDDEVKGVGNHIHFTFRGYDTRSGRMWSVDPLAPKYPFYSPYAFSGNRVMDAVELEGREPVLLSKPVTYLFDLILFGEKAANENLGYDYRVAKGFVERGVMTAKSVFYTIQAAPSIAKELSTNLCVGGNCDPFTNEKVILGLMQMAAEGLIEDYAKLIEEAYNKNPEAVGAIAFELAFFIRPGPKGLKGRTGTQHFVYEIYLDGEFYKYGVTTIDLAQKHRQWHLPENLPLRTTRQMHDLVKEGKGKIASGFLVEGFEGISRKELTLIEDALVMSYAIENGGLPKGNVGVRKDGLVTRHGRLWLKYEELGSATKFWEWFEKERVKELKNN